MTQLSGWSRLLRWMGRFLLVVVWMLALVYGAMVGWFLPICTASSGDGALGWSLFVLLVLVFYGWPVSLIGLVVAAAIASAATWFARPRGQLWRWCLFSVVSLLALGALVSWLSGGSDNCRLNYW
ncbi:hypothetical protein [Dyella silvatica]|uniref:hypothetical protein n=1 Tax=Dyella silvatica TaxID=2992128 RepID=UPI002253915A|nr:hypothetical protein [Dyella silvatica]